MSETKIFTANFNQEILKQIRKWLVKSKETYNIITVYFPKAILEQFKEKINRSEFLRESSILFLKYLNKHHKPKPIFLNRTDFIRHSIFHVLYYMKEIEKPYTVEQYLKDSNRRIIKKLD